MYHVLYLFLLLTSLSCLLFIDKRWKIAWYNSAQKTKRTILIGIIVFALWDVAGITLDIFFTGSKQYISGIFIAPDFPIEEIFFLTLLMYTALLTYKLLERKL